MKFVLILYMCMAGVCDSVYEQNFYNTLEDCEMASKEVMEYSKKEYPMASGKIWCLTEDEFKKYLKYLGQPNET